MALWLCTGCTTKYAVGLSRCPRCHGTEFVEDSEEAWKEVMAKITEHGGPSNVNAEPGQPGYVPPAEAEPETKAGATKAKAKKAADAEAKTEGGGRPSPGSSSSTSDEKPSQTPEPNVVDRPRPARTTASRSTQGRTGSSSARSTASDQTGSGTDDD